MFLRRRLLQLAEKYGPFVRFFPEGTEDADTEGADPPVSDDDAVNDVLKESEVKVEDSPQFKGLLRDRQADRAALAETNAKLAAVMQQNEDLVKKIEATQNKPISEFTEEELDDAVLRRDLVKTLDARDKKIIDSISKIINERETKNAQKNLKRRQAADAQTLMQTCTEKTKGLGLDAKTVVDEAIAYLSVNDPELLESLSKRPDFTTKIYQIAEVLVPSVQKRVTLRRNTLLAKKLDQKGDEVPGGGGPSTDETSVFEAIMSAGEEMPDEKLAQFF